MTKDVGEAAQQMLDALYGLEAEAGFGALVAATAIAVAGYMHKWGRTPRDAENMLLAMHEETISRMHEAWGQVRRNDC